MMTFKIERRENQSDKAWSVGERVTLLFGNVEDCREWICVETVNGKLSALSTTNGQPMYTLRFDTT